MAKKKIEKMMQARQGDVLLVEIGELPDGLTVVPNDNGRVVLAYGEVTGHSHAIPMSRSATLYRDESDARFLHVTAPVSLLHEEHAPVKLPAALYKVITPVEYSPQEIKKVMD